MEDRTVRRRRRHVYLWIFGVLAVLFIVWVVFFLPQGNNQNPNVSPSDTLAQSNIRTIPAEVSDYLDFVRINNDTIESGKTIDYASIGIEQLSGALKALVHRSSGDYLVISRKSDELKKTAQDLENKSPDDQAEEVKDAFVNAADMFQKITDEYYAGANFPDIDNAKKKAESLNEDKPLNEQLTDIRSYFNLTANAFRQLTNAKEEATF